MDVIFNAEFHPRPTEEIVIRTSSSSSYTFPIYP